MRSRDAVLLTRSARDPGQGTGGGSGHASSGQTSSGHDSTGHASAGRNSVVESPVAGRRPGPARDHRSRTTRRGIRFRLMMIAAVTVLVALIAGGGLLLVLLGVNLRSAAAATARSRAAEVAADLRSGGPDRIQSVLRRESRSGQVVQVVDHTGRVRATSTAVLASRPMVDLHPHDGVAVLVRRDLDSLGTPGEWLVVARGVTIDGELGTIQVAVPIEVEKQTVQTVALFLLGATPVLLAAVAAAVWLLVGRTLRPVERIRRTVSAVGPRSLSDRVPVPDARDEIAALAVTMNVMLARLEHADTTQRAFLSDAGHELRSPLAALRAALDLAERSDPVTRSELITTMSAEVDRMGGLVTDLITLARADDDRLIDRQVEVDVDDVVLSEVRRLRATSRHRIDLTLAPVRVVGDPGRLTQVLRNVLDNAERYARSRIRVELAAEPAGGVGILRVDNDGDPVPAGDRERVFQRFVRLDESRVADEGGRGLGLAISQQIVEAHGGRIGCGVAPDGDCRFEISLPAVGP